MYDVAWYCQSCGRIEAPEDYEHCPECGSKMQRCSRYEWFLSDELSRLLNVRNRKFRIVEQYPVADHRGFTWYWDLFVWVDGDSIYGGYGELIDVQGPRHKRQKRYSGPGGGYTRDYDKRWEAISNQKFHKRGIEVSYVTNEDCQKRENAVYYTAMEIVDDLIHRAGGVVI